MPFFNNLFTTLPYQILNLFLQRKLIKPITKINPYLFIFQIVLVFIISRIIIENHLTKLQFK